jgi:hypothetical protein
VSLSFYVGDLKEIPGIQMSDVESDDDAEVGATAVVVNGQDVNLCHQLSTKAFYGAPKSSARREPKGKPGNLECLEHMSVTGNSAVGQRAPSIRKTRRECLPPRRYND